MTAPPRRGRVEILTPRLRLRPAASRDLAALTALNAEPAVRLFLFDDIAWSAHRNASMIATSEAQYDAEGTGLFVVATDDRPAVLAGWAAFWYFHEPPVLELGYALSEGFWGRGYATEASHAMLQYGAGQLEMTDFHASTDVPNVASIRVLEKLGFQYVRRGLGRVHETFHYHRQGVPEADFSIRIVPADDA
jgi:RimJ/RimL family protein N-acetyltransferase